MAAIGQIMTALSTNQKTGLLKILKMRYIMLTPELELVIGLVCGIYSGAIATRANVMKPPALP